MSELRTIVAAVQSTTRSRGLAGEHPDQSPRRFVTISRQAGIAGSPLAHRLARALTEADPGDRPWQAFDRELVEKVAAERGLPASLINHFEDATRSWLLDILGGISFSQEPGEEKLYRHVSETVLALARAGRVVLVGRGANFLTAHLPGGVHVHLVAPLEHRIELLARQQGVGHDEAARRVRDIEANRQVFFKRHWPHATPGPEAFTLTINVAQVDEQRIADLVTPLVLGRVGVGPQASAAQS